MLPIYAVLAFSSGDEDYASSPSPLSDRPFWDEVNLRKVVSPWLG